jgi:hypothetical protein
MFQAPFPQILRMGALTWLLFIGLSAGFMYLLQDQVGLSDWFWKTELVVAIVGSSIFLLASLICRSAPPSVLWRMTFTGVLLFPPVFIFGTLGLSYLATTPEATRLWLSLLIVGVTGAWCLVTLGGYKQRVVERRFIEREFHVEDSRIVVRQPLKTNLDPKPISEHSMLGRIYHRFGPYLVMAIPMAYPIQRLLSNTGGDSAVLLLLALLGLPITIYFLGRMTCGCYLWIYRVWQIQRQHGKPVVFDVSECDNTPAS